VFAPSLPGAKTIETYNTTNELLNNFARLDDYIHPQVLRLLSSVETKIPIIAWGEANGYALPHELLIPEDKVES
jgi:hypothetical protein